MPPNVQSEAAGVVLLAGDQHTSRIVYHALKAVVPLRAVVMEGHSSRWQFLKKRIRRLGLVEVLGQLAFQTLLIPWLEWRAQERTGEICTRFSLDDSPIDPKLLTRVSSANSDETINLLREMRPAVVVINGTRIISRRVLEGVPAVFLNTHAGITPLFRGVHGGYWALAGGHRKDFGVTVHLVDPGVDTGGIIAQARTLPEPEDNFCTYPYLQLAAGLPLLKKAVLDALSDRISTIPGPQGVSKLWSHPTLWEYARNRWRFGVK